MDMNWRVVGDIAGFVVGTAATLVVFRHHRDGVGDAILVGGAVGVVGSEFAFLVYRNRGDLRDYLARFRLTIRDLLLTMAFVAAFSAWLGDHLRLSFLLDHEIRTRDEQVDQIVETRWERERLLNQKRRAAMLPPTQPRK